MYLYFETEHPQPYGWTSFHANWAFQVLVLVHEYYLMFSLQENYHCDCIREKTQGREYSWLKSLRRNVALAALEVSFKLSEKLLTSKQAERNSTGIKTAYYKRDTE